MVGRGLPLHGRAEPRDLRPVELAQHEPLPRRRRDARAASQRQPRRDPRGLRERHALRRRASTSQRSTGGTTSRRQLDMHHSHQSFATRQRLQVAGTDENQVIWFTDARPGVAFDQTPEAFEVIDEWMENIRTTPWQASRRTNRRAPWTAASTRRRRDRGRRRRVERRPRRQPAGRLHAACSRSTAPRAAWPVVRTRAASSSAASRASTRPSRVASTGAGCRAPPSTTACCRSSRKASATGARTTQGVRRTRPGRQRREVDPRILVDLEVDEAVVDHVEVYIDRAPSPQRRCRHPPHGARARAARRA